MHWSYPLIKAARYLNVAPWELAVQPLFWQDAALMCEAADENLGAFQKQRALSDQRFYGMGQN